MKIIYVHGIGKQLPPNKLKQVWDQALFGKSVNNTVMAYWADVLYPEIREVEDETDIRNTLRFSDEVLDQTARTFTEAFLKDVHSYMYDQPPGNREKIQARLLAQLQGEKKVVVVSHSLGTAIAYDVLASLENSGIEVPMFITIGSPLGIEFLQANTRKRLGVDVLSKPWCVKKWYNFADPLDVVAADKSVADEYMGGGVRDFVVTNPERMSTRGYGPHNITGYLSLSEVKSAVVAGTRTENPIYNFFYNLIG